MWFAERLSHIRPQLALAHALAVPSAIERTTQKWLDERGHVEIQTYIASIEL